MTTPGVASGQPADCEAQSGDRAIPEDRLFGVGRTARKVPAAGWATRPKELVEVDCAKQEAGDATGGGGFRRRSPIGGCPGNGGSAHWGAPTWPQSPATGRPVARSRARPIVILNSSNRSPVAGGLALTRYAPGGSPGATPSIIARRRLRSRFRTTAPPTFLLSAYATFASDQELSGTNRMWIGPNPPRDPELRSNSKVVREHTRPALAAGPEDIRDQADSRWRPFRRRERITARPALVDIRFRNPWVLARLRTFG